MLQVSNRALVKLKKQNIILVAIKRKSSPIYLFAIITSSTILTTGLLPRITKTPYQRSLYYALCESELVPRAPTTKDHNILFLRQNIHIIKKPINEDYL